MTIATTPETAIPTVVSKMPTNQRVIVAFLLSINVLTSATSSRVAMCSMVASILAKRCPVSSPPPEPELPGDDMGTTFSLPLMSAFASH